MGSLTRKLGRVMGAPGALLLLASMVACVVALTLPFYRGGMASTSDALWRYVSSSFLWLAVLRSLSWAILCSLSLAFVAILVVKDLRRTSIRFGWQFIFVASPLFFGTVNRLFGLVAILRDYGPLNNTLVSTRLLRVPLPILDTEWASILGFLLLSAPIPVGAMLVALRDTDGRFTRAAQDLGASDDQTFWLVLVLQGERALTAAASIVSILICGDFLTPRLLGGGGTAYLATLTIDSYLGPSRSLTLSAILSILLLATTTLSVLLTRIILRLCIRVRAEWAGRKDGRTRGIRLPWTALWLFANYLPPLAVVIYSFNRSAYSVFWRGFSWAAYNDIFFTVDPPERRALFVTMIVAMAASVLAITMSVGLAMALRDSSAMEALLKIAHRWQLLAPEVILGIGFATGVSVFRIRLGLSTLVLSHVIFITAFDAAILGIGLKPTLLRLLEVAEDLGAHSRDLYLRILLPLLQPYLIAGFMFGLLLSIDNYVVTQFSRGARDITVPTLLAATVRHGLDPSANALATLAMIASLTFGLVAVRFVIGAEAAAKVNHWRKLK
jgi:spermidine/putrescine transport system permease protein